MVELPLRHVDGLGGSAHDPSAKAHRHRSTASVSTDLGRRQFMQGGAAWAASASASTTAWARDATPADGAKVLRVSFAAAEAGFDPPRYGDLYSQTVCAHIFEALYTYDSLARPPKVIPLTAVGPPQGPVTFAPGSFASAPGSTSPIIRLSTGDGAN